MIYTKEVQQMCCVAKGANHANAPIPEVHCAREVDTKRLFRYTLFLKVDTHDIFTSSCFTKVDILQLFSGISFSKVDTPL